MPATMELHKQNVRIKEQTLRYAFLSDMIDKYESLTAVQKSAISSVLFALADDEPIGKGSI